MDRPLKPSKSKPAVAGDSMQRMVRRFRVRWHATNIMTAEVVASSAAEAVRLAKAGKFIERTLDAEPGEIDFSKAEAEESPNHNNSHSHVPTR